MKKAMFVFVFALTSAFAQVSETEKPVPASQKDVQGLQKELTRMRCEAQVAEKNSAIRSAEERQKMFQESKAAISATEKKLADKLESIERQAQKSNDDQMRTQRNFWFVIGGAVLIGLVFTAWFLKRNRVTQQIGASVPSEPSRGREVLIDPDIPALKEFSDRNNGTDKVPFILTLQSGQQFNCMAELKGGGLPPLVYVSGMKVPVAWDKRRQMAAKLLSVVQ